MKFIEMIKRLVAWPAFEDAAVQKTGAHAGVIGGQHHLHQEGGTVARDIPGQLVACPPGVLHHLGLPAPQFPQVAALSSQAVL